MTPLLINEEVRGQLKALVELAEANPVQMVGLLERLQKPDLKRQHMAQMTRQTIMIPLAFMVTYSVELGHPVGGLCRHMSMSVQRENRAPSPAGVWMVAQELGFWGLLGDCIGIWKEQLRGHGLAVNIVQPVDRNFLVNS